MKLSIGKTATGDNFFLRDDIVDEIYEALEEGQNLLLSAPRRVGKTSIIHYIKDNPADEYYCVYVDTEDVSDLVGDIEEVTEFVGDGDGGG